MLTVINAWNQRGWDAADHLLNDAPLTEMVGRRYASLATLKRAAHKRADSYPTVEYRDADGVEWRYDGSPKLPGRDVQVLTRLTRGER